MPNKKLNELSSRTPSLTDLALIGDPANGYAYQCTISALQGLFFNVQVTTVFGRSGNVVAADGDYTLTQLGDVTITTPASGQSLVYNGTTWVNGAPSNIYTSDGTLTGNRNVLLSGNSLTFNSSGRVAAYINPSGRFVINSTTTDTTFDCNVTGRGLFTDGLSVGSIVGSGTLHIRSVASSSGSLVISSGNFVPVSTIPSTSHIFSNSPLSSSFTGANNHIFGNLAGNSITTGSANILIGSNIGRGITTGSGNVMIGATVATNQAAATTNVINIIGGAGHWGDDASTIPATAHCFIGGGRFNVAANVIREYYWGVAPFSTIAAANGITFHAPSAADTSNGGGSFTIAGGRGTGSGTPGDIIFATSTTLAPGTTLQTLTNRVWIKGNTGRVGIGTSSPAVALDVVGDISMTGTFTVNGINNSGQNSYVSYSTNFANGEFSTYLFRKYTPTTVRSNLSSYTLWNTVWYDLTTASYTTTGTNIATSIFGQVLLSGNASTKATQPISCMTLRVESFGTTTPINMSDFRHIDIRPLNADGLTGHVMDNCYGLKISQMKGTTGFTITNGWGIYQEGSTDNNYFNGKVLIGTATPGGSPIRISGLPTSATGLSTGDLWNDSGTLKIA